jgi:hypothetical protein
LAASAKNGKPIEAVNNPISHRACPLSGGRSQPAAIETALLAGYAYAHALRLLRFVASL